MKKGGRGVAFILSATMLLNSVMNTAVVYGATLTDLGGDSAVQMELSEEIFQDSPDTVEAAEAAEEGLAAEAAEEGPAAEAAEGGPAAEAAEEEPAAETAEEEPAVETAEEEPATVTISEGFELSEEVSGEQVFTAEGAEETKPEVEAADEDFTGADATAVSQESSETAQIISKEQKVFVTNAQDYLYEIQSTDNFSYAVITGYTGSDTCVKIPEALGGKAVKEIALNAFGNNNFLEEIIIPSTVKSIGDGAFFGCESLKEVVLPEGLEIIGDSAFSNNGLEEIMVPFTVTTIGNSAFSGCESLTKATLAEGVKSIGEGAFSSCKALKEVMMSEGVEIIGNNAFSGDISLEEITIPSTVKSIGEYTFNGCSSLTKATLKEGVESIGRRAFFDSDALKEIILPSTVKSIGEMAFAYCDALKKAVLPEGLESMGNDAFSGDSSLEEINIPPSVKMIDAQTFSGCYSLKKVMLSEGLESIGKDTFTNYYKTLKEINIPSTVKSIGDGAFCGCESLKEVVLPEGLETIGDSAFSNNGLEEIMVPSTVTTIGNRAFSGCESLTKATLAEGVKSIGEGAFFSCKALKEVMMSEGVEIIGNNAFSGDISLKEITIPSTVKSTGEYTFNGCSSLTKATLKEGVESIGRNAFYANDMLEEIILPSTLKSIGLKAFAFCGSLKKVMLPEGLESIEVYAFLSDDSLEEIAIPSTVRMIDEGTFDNCRSLKRVILENVESIGWHAFCDNSSLKEIYIPDTVTKIDFNAFDGCNSLTFIVVPGSTAEAYAIEKEIPYRYYWDEGKNLIVDLVLPEKDLSLKGTTLVVEGKNFHVERYLDDSLKVSFLGVQENKNYQIRLISRFGDVLAEKNVLISKAETTIQMDNILPFRKLSASLLTEKGEDVAEKCEILWLREDGTTYRKGRLIEEVPDGMKLLCKVSLPETYGKVYQEPEAVECTASKKAVNCRFTLKKYEKGILKGILLSEDGPVSGGAVSLMQTLNGKYEVSRTARTDKNGYFEMAADKSPASLTVSAQTYFPEKVEITAWEKDEYDLGEISLKKVSGMGITVEMTYSPRTEEGAKPVKQKMDKRNDVSFSIYNKTTKKEVAGFVVQQEELVIYDGAREGDALTIRAESRSGDFEPTEGSCTIKKEKASVSLECVQKGKLELSYKDSKNVTNRFVVYKKNGTLEWTSLKQGKGSLQTDVLEEGTYTVAVMGGSDLIAYPSTLQGMKDMGLSEGADYLLQKVKVTRGLLQSVKFGKVPLLDESKYYVNVPEETVFALGRSALTVGNYVTLRMKTRLKKEYEGKLKNLKWVLEFPESCDLLENTISQADGGSASYVKDGNKYILSVPDMEKMLRMCVIPIAVGEHQIAASLQYEMNGKKIIQPVGSVQMTVGALSFKLRDKTQDTTVQAFGKSWPHMRIELYDNEVLVGQTTSNDAGQWKASFELYQPYTYSIHNIYAQMTDSVTGTSFRTADETLTYQYSADPVRVKCITMIYYEDVIYFDYEGKKETGGSYTYEPYMPDFTFLVEMSEGSFDKVKNPELKVHCSDGSTRTLVPVADKEKGCWVISSKFYSNCLPQNVGFLYDCDGEIFYSEEKAKELKEPWEETIEIFSENSLDDKPNLSEIAKISKETEKICKEYSNAEAELKKSQKELEEIYKIEAVSDNTVTVKFGNSEISGEVLSLKNDPVMKDFIKVPSNDKTTEVYIEKTDASLGEKQSSSMIIIQNNPMKGSPGVSGNLAGDKIATKVTISGKDSLEQIRKNQNKLIEKTEKLNEAAQKYNDASEKVTKEIDKQINECQERIEEMNNSGFKDDAVLESQIGLVDMLTRQKGLLKASGILGGSLLKGLGVANDLKAADNYMKTAQQLARMGAEQKAAGLPYKQYEHLSNESAKLAVASLLIGGLGAVGLVAGAIAGTLTLPEIMLGLAVGLALAALMDVCGNNLHDQIDDLLSEGRYGEDEYDTPAMPILDPSGYVYEAVMSNRLEDVTATCYEKVTKHDIYGEPYEEVQVWDASVYGQVNPQKTNREGYYGWDVPQGQWQVVYQKDGYKDARSDWMDVPPPRFDVNIGLVSFAKPKFTVRAEKEHIVLTFDRYMKTETVSNETVEVYKGDKKLTGKLTALNEEKSPTTGEKLATIFVFVPKTPLKAKDEVTVKVKRNAKTYADVNIENNMTVKAAAVERPTKLLAEKSLDAAYDGKGTIEVRALPATAAAGKKVKVSEYSSFMLKLGKTELVLDKEGKAAFTFKALLPGKSSVKFELEDTDLAAETMVTIANPQPTVKPQIKLSKTKQTLYTKGQTTFTLKANLTGISGKVSWTSSDEKIATVSSTGKVKAKKAGTVKITAKCGSLKAECKVTVKESKIKLSKTKQTLYTKGQTTFTLKASLTGISGKVSWTSSDKKIATVSSTGKVKAIKAGAVKITAKCDSLKAVCTVTVKKPSVKVAKSSLSVKKKKTVKIEVTALPKGKVSFTSSDKKIATVNSSGVVTGIRKGTATITVQCHGIKKKVKITVK